MTFERVRMTTGRVLFPTSASQISPRVIRRSMPGQRPRTGPIARGIAHTRLGPISITRVSLLIANGFSPGVIPNVLPDAGSSDDSSKSSQPMLKSWSEIKPISVLVTVG